MKIFNAMTTITRISLYKIIIIHLLVGINIQLLQSQSQAIEQDLRNDLHEAEQQRFPMNVESLEQNYNQLDQVESENLKVDYAFNLGRLYQKQSIEVNSTDNLVLEKGQKYYEDVLAIDRNHLPTRRNLVLLLQSAKDYDIALTHLDTLINEDYAERNRYYFTAGKIYLNQGKRNQALEAFINVLKVDPENYNAINQISFLFEDSMSIKVKDSLFNIAQELKYISTPFPSMRLLERYMSITEKSDPARAEDALIIWAELLSSKTFISQEEFRYLPSSDSIFKKHTNAIENLIRNPFVNAFPWEDSKDWEPIPHMIRMGLADQSLSQGNSSLAIDLLYFTYKHTNSLHDLDFSDDNKMFELRMKLIYSLIALLNEIPENRDSNINISELEEEPVDFFSELYSRKSQYYYDGDIIGQFKMHYLLANIYSDMDQWGSRLDYKTANFQLFYAAKRYDEILESNPEFYRPLPELFALLAKSYIIDSNERNDRKAAKNYLIAVKAYLDLDNLKMAKEYLNKIKSLTGYTSFNLSAEIADLEKIINIRDSLLIDYEKYLLNPVVSISKFNSLLNSGSYSQSFLRRQYFKIYSDLGRLLDKENLNPNNEYAKAFLIINQESALANTEDIERLRWINKSLSINLYNKNPNHTIHTFVPITYPDIKNVNSKKWIINLQNGEQVLAIEMDIDFKLISSLYLQLNESELKPSEEYYKFKVNNGTLYLPPNAGFPWSFDEIIEMNKDQVLHVKQLS